MTSLQITSKDPVICRVTTEKLVIRLMPTDHYIKSTNVSASPLVEDRAASLQSIFYGCFTAADFE